MSNDLDFDFDFGFNQSKTRAAVENDTSHYTSNVSKFSASYGLESLSFDLDGETINPDISTGESTVDHQGDVDHPDTTIPDQPNSDRVTSPLLPDEESFRTGFADGYGEDLGAGGDAEPPAATPEQDAATIAQPVTARLKCEQNATAARLYRLNLVKTMLDMVTMYEREGNGMAARAVVAALDPNNILMQTPEMVGCTYLTKQPNVGFESFELGGLTTALRNLWESIKNKVFRQSTQTALDLVHLTLVPAIKTNDEEIATAASSLAALYAAHQVTDDMIAGATYAADYIVLKPQGVTAMANSMASLHAAAVKAVAETLPTDVAGLNVYTDKVGKILKSHMDTFGVAKSVEGAIGRNLSYGSIVKDMVHVPAGKSLSTAGYTTQKQVLDGAKLISEKCQMATVGSIMETFAKGVVAQLATIAGTVTPDNKAQIDERITVVKAAACFTIAILDEVARQSVSDLVIAWIAAMRCIPVKEKI